MACPPAPAPPATAPRLAVSPPTLVAALAAVPDPRRQAGIAYPLPAVLALAVAAMVANRCSVLAIAEWGARQSQAVLAPLGSTEGRTPCQARWGGRSRGR